MRLPLIYKRTGPQSGTFFMFLFLLPIFPFLPWYCIFPRTLAIKAELSQPWMKSCISKVCYTVLKGDVGISVDFCQHLQITDVAISQVSLSAVFHCNYLIFEEVIGDSSSYWINARMVIPEMVAAEMALKSFILDHSSSCKRCWLTCFKLGMRYQGPFVVSMMSGVAERLTPTSV